MLFQPYREKADPKEHVYKAEIIRVIDGDSIECKIDLSRAVDLGFHFTKNVDFGFYTLQVRLLGIDASEMNSSKCSEKSKALRAKEKLQEILQGRKALIQTEKSDSFGRWLGTVWSEDITGVSVNEWLLLQGFVNQWVPRHKR